MFIRITILKGDSPWSARASEALTIGVNTLILFGIMSAGVACAHLLLMYQGKIG